MKGKKRQIVLRICTQEVDDKALHLEISKTASTFVLLSQPIFHSYHTGDKWKLMEGKLNLKQPNKLLFSSLFSNLALDTKRRKFYAN